MILDDPAAFSRLDPGDALGAVEGTAAQWRAARDLAGLRLDLDGVNAIVIAGMGGSGIAGDVVVALAEAACAAGDRTLPPVPVVMHKGYGLPPFAGARTLVVACSYSGNTEETLSCADAAGAAGARLAVVTTGGTLGERAEAWGAPLVRIPGGLQPRLALGHLAVPVLVALGLDGGLDEALAVQDDLIATNARTVPLADNPSKRLAMRLADGSLPLSWGARPLGTVAAYRLRCQLNENAKLPAFSSELPELDHNEIVGLAHASALAAGVGVVALRDPVGEHPRIIARFRVTTDLVRGQVAWVEEVTSHGRSPLARLASLLLLADFAAVYTALALEHDPTPVPPIDRLKKELAAL
ncbi:MAG: bifunctional phosphoglucose/phosphomannose isomerase [Nitriliruptorales bacterium]|nr:bifunctional phosphoglucose/phosphomannose isomerase [Nitriliruptorales bacterium]